MLPEKERTINHVPCRLLVLVAAGLVALPCGAGEPPPIPQPASVQRVPADGPWRDLSLHVYGFSYHTDREGIRRQRVDNEFNPGLGIGYEFHSDARGSAFVNAGIYKDSSNQWAKLAGPGYQFKLGDSWRVGALLPVIQGKGYNQGRAFVAPLPLLTYDFGTVKLNAVYAPRFAPATNFAVFAFYFSIPLESVGQMGGRANQ